MSGFSTELIPLLVSFIFILFSIVSFSFVTKIIRRSTYTKSSSFFSLSTFANALRVDFESTTIYSLLISLIRFNLVLFITCEVTLNIIFGSRVDVYDIFHVFGYVMASEFLWFLNVKNKEDINEISNFLVISLVTFTIFALVKQSLNIGNLTSVIWVKESNFFAYWEVLNIPLILIPMFKLLEIVQLRILKAKRELAFKTASAFFDLLTEHLLFVYLCVVFIKCLFAGSSELSDFFSYSSIPWGTIVVTFVKFVTLAIFSSFLIRFTSLLKNKKENFYITNFMLLMIVTNIGLIIYIRGII